MAARGARDLDGGRELLTDPDEVAYFRVKARRIYWRSFFATLVLIVLSRAWLYWRG